MKKNNFLNKFIDQLMGLFNKKNACKECLEQGGDQGVFCYKDEGRTKEMLSYSEIIEMLKSYDTTRIEPMERALGHEDTRINTFDFNQFKKYLGHIENLSKKTHIRISGISFIAGVKAQDIDGKQYTSLIYMPSTLVDGNEVLFDPVQSAKQGKVVTFKEMLEKYGYNWIYDTAEKYAQDLWETYSLYTKKIENATTGIQQLLGLIYQTKEFKYDPNEDFTLFLNQIWSFCCNHEQLRAITIQISSEINRSDIMMILADKIALENL